jgi:hypothetical protein
MKNKDQSLLIEKNDFVAFLTIHYPEKRKPEFIGR